MKRVFSVVGLVVVPFLATLVAALYFLGVFPSEESWAAGGAPRPTPTTPAPPPVDLATREPVAEPRIEIQKIAAPVRVLVLAEVPTRRSFVNACLFAWEAAPMIEWQVWSTTPGVEGAATHSRSLPALAAPPTAADLADVGVLFLAAIDPKSFPPEFWARVADRVREGRLGLLVVPNFNYAKALADEPSLRTVLPVSEVLPPRAISPAIGGTPATIPGVYEAPRPFAVTPDGTEHPATRIVPFKTWSERIWTRLTTGPHAWSSKFVPPVLATAPGARTLVTLLGGDAAWPAFVASGGEKGRALWLGGILEIEWDFYREPTAAGYDAFRSLAVAWIDWLAPR